MKGVYVIILFTLSCVNVFLQKVSSETVAVTSTAGTPCLYHLIPGQALQDCVTTIGFLNSTVNEPDELCFMYSEALYCIMRAVDKAGVNCSLSDVERITEPYFHIVPELTFDHCNVTGPPTEVTDICAPKSLSMITFITCRPYLEEMVSFGGGMSCILSKYLLTCINSNLGYFGAKCSETEIQTAVDSPTAAAWLQTHYPAISLKTCFHHEGVKPDPVCTDTLTMFNYQDLPHCPSILSGLNFTGPGALSPKIGCSLINEVLVCMQNSLAKHGGRCTLAQMKASLKSFLHLSAGIFAQENVLDNCQVDETYSTTSICKDNYRLATYLTTTLNQLFDLITGYPSDSAKCSYVVSYSHTTLTSIGVNCSDDDILAALTSSYGQSVMTSLYPSIHLDYCLNYFTSPMTPQQDTPRRKRNAVPYAIDESDLL